MWSFCTKDETRGVMGCERCNGGEGYSDSSAIAILAESWRYWPVGRRIAGIVYGIPFSFGGRPLLGFVSLTIRFWVKGWLSGLSWVRGGGYTYAARNFGATDGYSSHSVL